MPRKKRPLPMAPLAANNPARLLTEAEKAEMEANPLPAELPGGEGVDSSGAAAHEDNPEQVPFTEAEALNLQDTIDKVFDEANAPQPTFMQGVLKCHTCGRTGEEDLGECPNRFLPNFTCPEPTAINPDTDVVLHSAHLGIIRTVPVEALVRGHAKNYLAGCHSDDCGYKVLHPKSA